ncbi:undecaprenyldiphospho-muramoylpentapeptide beta-N-acetylglucosaminyltransferase [Ectobacillus antri]|uniref:UDP-N-acetylglucosamine--N-acetylmuramyl-(pentapeptide) pyrophosphoryl-undecaprenol N-acetylglucosamine transferase n=1 Tax=Ectobacillus antri TaxID=2486280 RepID=A0ABT6H4E6_9BACI|nr:undecaprenyldiphospho-muramoylpentapeptide beta-N-acetylglucosaminyltransferase [Ectobacillus antri]MDG4655538.1 undecaprenyldiphospho-muramoylpentapeptide beta-N-acetylglucosaminyltransferase [Ectobacillus antri]MDG5753296.1 undecaprenyldiphospho-muramoylpentapeptide beta-N-acetylglucosaminyltransferase [Ectobacillus antri]
MKTIVFTGGGSAGHVTPNLALIPKLQEGGWNIHYIGSKTGIEKDIIEKEGIPYHEISSGKLRRYFDMKNFKDPFLVMKGVAEAYFLIRKLKPDVIFSKGGFVSVPVVIAGWMNRIPVFLHESDITPGLANKIAIRFATKIFVTFEEAIKHLPAGKAVHTGSPIREDILKGNRESGLRYLGFTSTKPVITIMGGSLGAKRINETVREALPQLLEMFQIVHLCGKGNRDESLNEVKGYQQFEYVSDELPDIMAATDMVISRAGSNAIFEFLTLQKPMILIPLPKASSRGDQILNAAAFEKKGYCRVLQEEQLTEASLLQSVNEVYGYRLRYKENMRGYSASSCLKEIIEYIEKASK